MRTRSLCAQRGDSLVISESLSPNNVRVWKSLISIPCSSHPMWLIMATVPSTPAWFTMAFRLVALATAGFIPVQAHNTPVFPKHTSNFAALCKSFKGSSTHHRMTQTPQYVIGGFLWSDPYWPLKPLSYTHYSHTDLLGEGRRDRERDKEWEERECEQLPPNPDKSAGFPTLQTFPYAYLSQCPNFFHTELKNHLLCEALKPKGCSLPSQPAWNP